MSVYNENNKFRELYIKKKDLTNNKNFIIFVTIKISIKSEII